MPDLKKFIPKPPNRRLRTQYDHQTQYSQCHTPKDYVLLRNKLGIDFWLRLVELRFDYGPAQGVENGLDENDVSKPTVQEIEVLIGDTGKQGEQAFAVGEKDGEWCQSVSKGADAVAEAAETGARVVESGIGDGSHPGLVCYAAKTVSVRSVRHPPALPKSAFHSRKDQQIRP